ncbi:MAG: hypothetical protein HYW69_03410 [Candidatus Nealsonbacteria bacterium]|nr:hypothetical protein [Candidatus Nealsonbacteria bacterium]
MNNPYVKTLEPVWRDTKDVRVNEEKLQELIKDMRQKKEKGELIIPAWAVPNIHPPIDCGLKEWVDYVCWINTVNFAFTNFEPPYNKFAIEYPKGNFLSGSAAMAASFMRAKKEGIPIFEAETMNTITWSEINYIFRPVDEEHKMPMLQKRWEIIREAADDLLGMYDGQWLNLFRWSNWRAFDYGKGFNYQGIIKKLVTNFFSFGDTREYGGQTLEFHKRAQLLVMMYHGRAANSGGRFPLIKDINDIGPIADYDVPKALHFLGVLGYSSRLESAIENHSVIVVGHPWETENRLGQCYVMWRICEELSINMAQADYYIWEMGRKSKSPHILVPTTSY